MWTAQRFLPTAMVLAICGCSYLRPSRPDAAFQDVYRSARSIQAALEVGATYAEFGALIQVFARDLKLLNDRIALDPSSVPPEAADVAKKYGDLLEAYRDANTAWSTQIRGEKYSPELQELAAKYRTGSADVDRIRQSAWSRADSIQTDMTRFLFGKPPALPSK